MANNTILSNNKNDIVDVRQKSLYARLKRLFSTDVVVRNTGGKKLKIKDTDEVMYATDRNSLRDRFNRVRSTAYNAYTRDFAMAYQAARMDLFRDYDCVGADTIVPLPDGSRPTIKELAEKYKDNPQERFLVFSYDHKTDSIKLGNAYHPRKKAGGPRKAWKVIFDNDQYVIGSAGHPFLMRNGEYKKLEDLKIGESVMPFYQKLFYPKKHYRFLYNFSKGWQAEHKIIAEQFDRNVESNEVVHHRDFNKSNNLPNNLQIMDKQEHASYHAKLIGDRSGKKNPFYGKSHSKESNKKRSDTLKTIFKDRNISFNKNPNYRKDISIDLLCEEASEFYKENGKLTSWGLVNKIGCDYSVLQNRLKNNKLTWSSFKQNVTSTLNHKIKSIEYVGEIEVYDVTVEKYQNFATDSCFVHNTMDMDPIIASALDIYADECFTKNEMGNILTIHSSNNNIKEILNNLFYEILNIEYNIWSWTRNMCKYGDFYLRLYINPEYGVYLVEPISSYNIERIENSDPSNKNYVKFQVRPTDTTQAESLESYEIAHFRLLSDSNFLPYGKSVVEGARRVWKQLSLMEDAMLIHRIMRAPDKRVFKIDIGNIPHNEVDAFMEKMISKLKKVPYIDERTGDYNLRFNLQNMTEDFILPVRGNDSGTSIEPLGGMEFTGIDDIEYLRNKMMSALKIPKAFLGYEEGISGKATLASEDVRFARTIQRVQRFILSELSKIAVVHLYAQGYRDASLVDFSLELTNPSTIFEKEKIDIWSAKSDVAKSMMEYKLFSKTWIYKNIFSLSDDDEIKLNNQIIEDSKQGWRFKQIEEEGNDPAKPFQKINPNADESSSGRPGGDLGGLPDLGGPEGPDLGEPPEMGGGPGDEPRGLPPLEETFEGDDLPPIEEIVNDEPTTSVEETIDDLKNKERNRNRESQKGEKDAKKYPFGEDPLGSKENTSKPRKGREIRHVFKNNSPLSLESAVKNSTLLTKLDGYLKSVEDEKKQLLKETTQKSLLDESNIKE